MRKEIGEHLRVQSQLSEDEVTSALDSLLSSKLHPAQERSKPVARPRLTEGLMHGNLVEPVDGRRRLSNHRDVKDRGKEYPKLKISPIKRTP